MNCQVGSVSRRLMKSASKSGQSRRDMTEAVSRPDRNSPGACSTDGTRTRLQRVWTTSDSSSLSRAPCVPTHK